MSQTGPLDAPWYYIGTFGQLGPLTVDQMIDLINSDVVKSSTLVWRSGMADWIPAESIPEFSGAIRQRVTLNPPPSPPPSMNRPTIPTSPYSPPGVSASPTGSPYLNPPHFGALVPYSDKSRIAAGILNIIVPGVGRMYLGFVGLGIAQLFVALCTGVGWIWPLIDGILILTGNVKTDATGSILRDN